MVTINESLVDWNRTDAYAAAVRARHYATTRGEEDFALLTGEVTRALNDIALMPDPLRRLAMAEPLEEAETTAAGRTRGHGGVRYECPDHPDAIVRLAPTCGVCGRRLVATHEDEGRAAG